MSDFEPRIASAALCCTLITRRTRFGRVARNRRRKRDVIRRYAGRRRASPQRWNERESVGGGGNG